MDLDLKPTPEHFAISWKISPSNELRTLRYPHTRIDNAFTFFTLLREARTDKLTAQDNADNGSLLASGEGYVKDEAGRK